MAGSFGVVVLDHTVGECAALPGGVVHVLVPRTLVVQQPVVDGLFQPSLTVNYRAKQEHQRE